MIKHINEVMAVSDQIKHTSCSEAKSIDPQDTLFIDVRSKEAFTAGHIPNAIHCERGLLEFLVADGSPIQLNIFNQQSHQHCIVYCNGGRQSVLAAKTLQDLGVRGVKNLLGGYAEWVATESKNT